MARNKDKENKLDPATGRPLPQGVQYRGPLQYRSRKLVDGSRITKTFISSRLAREWLDETAVKVREREFVDRRVLTKSTLSELVQKYVDAEMKDGGRRRGAAQDRGHIPSIKEDAIGALTLARVTPAAVRAFRDRQAAKMSPATVVKRLNLLAGILSHARAEWDVPLPENPASAKAVKRPAGADKKRDRRLMPPTPAALREAATRGEAPPLGEEERLLAEISGSVWPHDQYLVQMAIAQAMRQGELLELRWKDIDLEGRTVVIRGVAGRGSKADAHRTERGHEVRPLMAEAITVLDGVRPADGAKPGDKVFKVGPAAPFRVRFGRATKKAGLEDLTFHDLRHEGTSRLAKRYPNPLDLKRVTGHADIKSLDRYYQPDLGELARRGD